MRKSLGFERANKVSAPGSGDALDDFFNILTQNLVYSEADGYDELPEVDQLFSQVLLPSEFDFGLLQPSPSESSVQEIEQSSSVQETEICKELDAPAETLRPSRFGPLVSQSDIAGYS